MVQCTASTAAMVTMDRVRYHDQTTPTKHETRNEQRILISENRRDWFD